MHLKISPAKWRPFCLGLNVLKSPFVYSLFWIRRHLSHWPPISCDSYIVARWLLMTSSNGTIFRVTGPFAGNSPIPVNSPHNGQWGGALMFSLICAWINDSLNNREAGYLRRHRTHYDVNAMCWYIEYKTHSSWQYMRYLLIFFSMQPSHPAFTGYQASNAHHHFILPLSQIMALKLLVFYMIQTSQAVSRLLKNQKITVYKSGFLSSRKERMFLSK